MGPQRAASAAAKVFTDKLEGVKKALAGLSADKKPAVDAVADVVLNNLVAWAFTSLRVHIKSDGTPWRPIVHIEDISRAFITVLQAPREIIHNQAFNVGRTEENYRVREKLAQIAQIVRTA